MIGDANPLIRLLCVVLTVYTLILFVRVLLSWATLLGFRPPYSGPMRSAIDLLDDVTEPVLRPLRALIPPVRMGGVGLDVSIILAFVILAVVRSAIGC